MSGSAYHETGHGLLSAALVVLLLATASCGETAAPTGPDPDPDPTNSAPVANAGADQTVNANLSVTLDGSASADADGDAITYSWSITSSPAGSAAALDDTSAERPTFVPDVAGAYAVQLVVSDGTDESAGDAVVIEAEDNTVRETIGVNGGAIASADGSFDLTVPAGALTEEVEIRMTPVPAGQLGPDFDGIGEANVRVYDLQPSGLAFDVPATVTFTQDDAVTEDDESVAVRLGVAFTLSDGASGLEAEVLHDATVAATRGEAGATLTGTVDHFSRFVTLANAVHLNVTVPRSAETGAPFDVRVAAVAFDDEFEDLALEPVDVGAAIHGVPAQTDASGPLVAPESGFDGVFTGDTDAGFESTNPYVCSAVGTGTYRTQVDVTYSAWPPENITIREFAGNLPIESHLTLETPVLCVLPPAPPPESFTDVPTPMGEAITVVSEAGAGTVYGVADENGVKLFDDNGLVTDEIFFGGAGTDGPLIGLIGRGDAGGEGSLLAFGPGGIYEIDPADAHNLIRVEMDVPDVTDNTTSVTDGFFWDFGDGPQEEPVQEDRFVFAQFEDRNVLFLEEDGMGGFAVVPELADAFVQNGVSIFGSDRPLSLWIGPDGFDEDHPMLVLTIADDTFGDLNVVSLVNGVAERTIVPDFTSIIEPRQLRCDDETGICGMSSFRTTSFGGIYTFRWDGQDGVTRLTPRLSFAPVGIDVINTGTSVLMTGTDTKRFANGAFQYEFRVIEFGLNGAQLGSAAFLVPEGCVDPFHAVFRRRIADFDEVLLSCNGDDETEGRVVGATFTHPSG